MKTVCLLNNKVIMSQDGDAVEAMTQNAEQYPGSTVEVVSDEEFNNLINTNETKIALCKKQASSLLYQTDWTTIPDVASPTNNPYLTNQAEFITWRSQIRELAVNPVVDPTWPTEPTPVWG
jgi:hypothetical protein